MPTYDYGLWQLVILNVAIFLLFAFSFYKPRTSLEWRAFGGFSAFIIALFVEMYGFPLTIFLLSSWLGSRFPNINSYAHDAGHLWQTVFRIPGNPHFNVLHIVSTLLIFFGFYLLAEAWHILHVAQRGRHLATTGPYAYVRHPQYIAFVLIMIGFFLQWPTLVTAAMLPILIAMYVRLARREEAHLRQEFGSAYEQYSKRTPGFIPRLPSAAHAAP